MSIRSVTDEFLVSPQIALEDIAGLPARGIKGIVNNRPDGEQDGQPTSAEIEAAATAAGLAYRHIPVVPGKITAKEIAATRKALAEIPGPVLGFCRSGTRAVSLWALARAGEADADELIAQAEAAGHDIQGLRPRLETVAAPKPGGRKKAAAKDPVETFDVLIVGGGAAGIAVAASLLKKRRGTSVAIIEPSEKHYYQAGFTLVGGGAFTFEKTVREEARCIPRGAKWIRSAVEAFEPEANRVVLEDGERVGYRRLVVCPGLKLDWHKVDGLWETLGKNGVTSNYLPGMARYTWELIQATKGGEAVFTQPPMPIKCAGAPQKIMYLACDHWRREGALGDIHVEFDNAGGVLFGVSEFVPPLMKYVERYGIDLQFNTNLVAIDGPGKTATFERKDADGKVQRVTKSFDMIHVCPPQCAPDFVRTSPLADEAGWLAVDPETLRSPKFDNVYALGDVCSAPNAKTAAAVRKQAPVVVHNLIRDLNGTGSEGVYDGYGSCPLIVERGKVILAEFGYGGKLLPTFPLNPTVPRWIWWILKARILPFMYWDMLFKGRDWGAGAKTR